MPSTAVSLQVRRLWAMRAYLQVGEDNVGYEIGFETATHGSVAYRSLDISMSGADRIGRSQHVPQYTRPQTQASTSAFRIATAEQTWSWWRSALGNSRRPAAMLAPIPTWAHPDRAGLMAFRGNTRRAWPPEQGVSNSLSRETSDMWARRPADSCLARCGVQMAG